MNRRTLTRKTTLCLLLFIRVVVPSLAQGIEGQVQDTQHTLLPFANVMLLRAQDSSMVSGTVTDTKGRFHFNSVGSGRFLIQAQMIGYQSTYTPLQTGTGPAAFFTLTLPEETRELEEVMITSQKPLYEKELDRTIVNVQSSVTSTGKSVLEVLAKSPGVLVNRQNNSLSMYGKNGVMVMINGKMSRLPTEALVQMLNGMNAANIDKIELITSPPAKYDAEGNAGIINIVMIENADFGTNGTLGLTAGFNQGPTGGGNLNFNHRREKANFFMDYSVLSDKNQDPWISERTLFGQDFDRTVISDQQRTFISTVHNLRTGMEYTLSPRTIARLLVSGYRRNWDLDGLTVNVNRAAPDSVIQTTMKLHESNIWQNASASIGLEHQINERQSLQFNADYLYYVNDNPSSYDNTIFFNEQHQGNELIDVTKDTPIQIKVAKVDYTNQLTDGFKVDIGLKGSFSSFANDVLVQRLKENQWVTDEDFSDKADLNEKILAGYASFDWKATDALKIYGGLRYEHTDTYLSTTEEEGVVDREYGNLFPSINVAQALGEKSRMMLAYARRTVRPVFSDMAPFVFFTGPNSFFSGNPALRPSIANGFDLSYQYQPWWVSLKYTDTRNSIAIFQPELNTETNQQVIRAHNMKYFRDWSLSVSLPFAFTNWWELQADVSVHRQAFETSYLEENFGEQSVNVKLSGSSTFILPRDFTIELSGNYQSRELWGVMEFRPYGQLDVGVKKNLPNHQGVLTLNFADVFHTSVWDARRNFPNSEAYVYEYYDPNVQSVTLTYSRSFGNRTLKSVRLKSGAEEERQRMSR